MNRRDWRVGRLHFIRYGVASPQYGVLAWGYEPYLHTAWTLDVFVGRFLFAVRWDK